MQCPRYRRDLAYERERGAVIESKIQWDPGKRAIEQS